jgi:type II secretion system (T2SS) protein E
MRIGELLRKHGWVTEEALVLALMDQASSGMRLCSLLVERGAIAFDQASRALGEQQRCAAVLLRHLEGRDPELAARLPEESARALIALPIGRLGTGALIVCVRDPSAATLAAVAKLVGEEPVLAVAPARYLERLIDDAYAPQELEAHELEEEDPEIDVPIVQDEGDDFQIDVEMPAARTKRRAMSVIVPTLAASPQKGDSLDAALAAFRDIDAPGWLFDVAMEYVAKHWTGALLMTVNEKRAVGLRGHGEGITPKVARTCVLDFAEVAMLELARTSRRIVHEAPRELGAEHPMLATLLGTGCPIVAPIVQSSSVSHLLALADPVGDREDALVDLELLVDALGTALARM